MVNTNVFFSLAILSISIARAVPFKNATPRLSDDINPFCSSTENKTLCTSMINDAMTWPSATTNAIYETLKIAAKGKPMIDDLVNTLKDFGFSRISKDSIKHTCNEVNDFAIECLEGALDDIRYGYIDGLITKLSVVTGPSFECTNSVKKLGIDSQLFNYFLELELYSRICLSITRVTLKVL